MTVRFPLGLSLRAEACLKGHRRLDPPAVVGAGPEEQGMICSLRRVLEVDSLASSGSERRPRLLGLRAV